MPIPYMVSSTCSRQQQDSSAYATNSVADCADFARATLLFYACRFSNSSLTPKDAWNSF